MRGLVAIVSVGVVLGALAGAHAERRVVPPTPTGPVPTSLPPGLWFRTGHYEAWLGDAAPATPTYAVIAGVFGGAAQAERASRAVDRAHVDLGFPWAVASHSLRIAGRCREAIVIVVGLFASRSDAERWRGADATRHAYRVVPLEADDAPSDCREVEVGHLFDVVQIEPTRDAPAYAARDLERALETDDGATALRRLAPTCTVPRGTIGTFDETAQFRFGHRFAPARCDGRVVYVPVEHTLRQSWVEPDPDGSARLYQVTDVSCDAPAIDAWRFSRDGRAVIEGQEPTFTAPCAG